MKLDVRFADQGPTHDQVPAVEVPAAAEIDLSSEWDDSITIETEAPPAAAAEAEASDVVGDHDIPVAKPVVKHDPEKTAEAIEEFRFYLEHGMPEQASSAFAKIQSLTSDEATLRTLRAEMEAASHTASATEETSTVEAVEAISEFTIDEPVAEIPVEPIPSAKEAKVEATSVEPAAVAETHAPPPAPVRHPAAATPVAPAPGVLQEFVSDLESTLGETFLPGAVPHEPTPAVAHASTVAHKPAQPELEHIGNAAPTTFGLSQPEPMGEFVADLEASLGDDFLKGAPVADPETTSQAHPATQIAAPVAATPTLHWPSAAAPASPVNAPVVNNAAAAAASSGTPAISRRAPTPPPPTKSQAAPASRGTAGKASAFGDDAGVDLAEMFGELKHDLEAGAATTEEDPETHYNLGIAFREMGLLDEAIGELQKTCQAVDRGNPFPLVMQTYTWLAQCFLDKGVPEAAIRWYQKALSAPAIDEETRTALHYEIASAYEAAGDKPAALKNFMEVYGRNIDYRDVAERIKALKS